MKSGRWVKDNPTRQTKRKGGFKMAKSGTSKRELIDTGNDKRYVRRDEKGRFDEVDEQSRSLSQDVRKHAKTRVKAGQGDKGDQQRKK
jgi:hypothetical protein